MDLRQYGPAGLGINSTTDSMVVVSKTELILTHFYINPNFLLALLKDPTDLNPK